VLAGPGADVPVDLHVLVVAGTVTARLAPVLAEAFAHVPAPRAVLAFGACAATGGPYWDSYCVLPGAHEVIAVDAWVAGCPPRPEDLLAGLEEVVRAHA
jgi:NADH-quinone oxidoreductase subunit B